MDELEDFDDAQLSQRFASMHDSPPAVPKVRVPSNNIGGRHIHAGFSDMFIIYMFPGSKTVADLYSQEALTIKFLPTTCTATFFQYVLDPARPAGHSTGVHKDLAA